MRCQGCTFYAFGLADSKPSALKRFLTSAVEDMIEEEGNGTEIRPLGDDHNCVYYSRLEVVTTGEENKRGVREEIAADPGVYLNSRHGS
jgi:hypothetical protein